MKKINLFILLLIIFLCLININIDISANVPINSNCVALDYNTNRIIYENNKDKVMLPASITKILTCIVAIENGDLNEYYKVDYETISQIGSSIYMDLNDEMKLYDLLCGLMMRSGNDCAYLIASNVFESYDIFIEEMNSLARKIGMNNSVFNNPSGLDSKDIRECNYTTCYDMAILMRYCFSNEVFREINKKTSYKCESKNGKVFVFYNKHKLIKNNDDCIGGKTGYTKLAERTLVSVFERKGCILIVVTMKCSNDWDVHLSLWDYYNDVFDNYVFLKRGILDVSDLDYNYTPIIYEDVSYLLKEDEDLKIELYLFKKDNDGIIGYFNLYLVSQNKNIFVKRIFVYRYY